MDKNRHKTGGRQKGTPNRVTKAARDETQAFFTKILSDKAEAEEWQKFISGESVGVVAWQAFKRAVEYKRGMPVQPNEHSGPDGETLRIVVEHIGRPKDTPSAQTV